MMDGQAKARASGADGGGAWGTSAGSYDRAAPTFEPFAEWLAELCLLREDIAEGGDFTFTCHAYGVVCDKA